MSSNSSRKATKAVAAIEKGEEKKLKRAPEA